MSGSSEDMRIVSLLPSITEIVAALGLGDKLVGVTHECDYPPKALEGTQVVTSSEIQPYKMTQAEIHEAVSGSLANGHSLYGMVEETVKSANPTIVLTQALCDVCAVSYPTVLSTCGRLLGDNPRVISLEPTCLEEVFTTITTVGKECQVEDRAAELVAELREGLAKVKAGVTEALEAKGGKRPRIAFLEWIDPLFTGGHWVPDMLDLAGAEYTLAKSCERSEPMTNEALAEYDPDVILVAPCGFDTQRALEDTQAMYKNEWWRNLRAVKAGDVYAADANSYYARPGPRLVQGAAIVAQILHGVDVGLAPEGSWVKVTPPPQNSSSLREFLLSLGTAEVTHVGGNPFFDHLCGVEDLARKWGLSESLCSAALFHSIYGTQGFQAFCVSVSPESRGRVRQLVGEPAEATAFHNCVMDRGSLDQVIMQDSLQDLAEESEDITFTIQSREETGAGPLILTKAAFLDLVTVHLCDWLEQVEREAGKADQRHGWEVGDAWGYRRRAFRKMATLVGGVALRAYDEIFAREPEATRGFVQDVTPEWTPDLDHMRATPKDLA